MPEPLLIITGPTASGKSAFAMEMAKKYHGEIICADSRTVYKDLDIGTAKPTLQDRQEVPHHLLDIVAPDEPFSAADFKQRALMAITDITKRGHLPIMVGGTGLYIDAIFFDYQFGATADPLYRQKLQAMTVPELQQMCLNNVIALPTNDQNKRHLVRAIELGGLLRQERKPRPNTLVVALTTEKDILRSRIEQRAQHMVQDGVLREVKQVGEKYNWSGEALTGNIYRTFKRVVTGEINLQEGIDQFVTSDMQLAKRQATWLKRNPHIVWGSQEELKLPIEHFVQQIMRSESIPAAR